jgi:hypothetical protein
LPLAIGEADGQTFSELLPGQEFGRFRLLRQIGQGGFGMVFLAFDYSTERQVALKTLHPHRLIVGKGRERFLREVRCTARLDHPNVVRLLEAGEIDGRCYLVMAYVPGPSLHRWLQERQGPISAETAAQVVIGVAEGLHHAHTHGIIHRDLTPGNVLLLPRQLEAEPEDGPRPLLALSEYIPCLTDFGLARELVADATSLTEPGQLVGTAAFLAPETISNPKIVSATADIWGLGVLLYRLLAGRLPFDSAGDPLLLQISSGVVRPPSNYRSNLAPALEAICLKCLSLRPENGYASAAEVAEDLGRWLRGESTIARPQTLWQRAMFWCWRHPMVPTIGLGVMFGLIALILALDYHNRELRRLANQLHHESEEVRQGLEQANELAYVSDMRLIGELLAKGEHGEVRQMLSRYHNDDRRGFEWYLYAKTSAEPTRVIEVENPGMIAAAQGMSAIHRDGRTKAVRGDDGVVRLIRVSNGREVGALRVRAAVQEVGFSVDGEWLLVRLGPNGRWWGWRAERTATPSR